MPPFSIQVDDLDFVGSRLRRPECVLCTASGATIVSDWRGGVVHIHPDGSQSLLKGMPEPGQPVLQPNGIALERQGSLLLADLSEARAGVWRLHPATGIEEPFLLDVDGEPLPPVNFVYLDKKGRLWITISTTKKPRALDYRPTASSGFIVLVEKGRARVVADELGYTNECKLNPTGEWLYVNETFARRLTRFRVKENGSLGKPETVTTFGPGTFPDGLAFDVEGGIWVTSIVSNRLIRVDEDGKQTLILEDNNPDHLRDVEDAFQAGVMGRPHLDAIQSRRLQSISSVAFGGDDLKTVYLGCLLGDRLASFRSPDSRCSARSLELQDTGKWIMKIDNEFRIAVLPGDGIGREVMESALAVLNEVQQQTPGLVLQYNMLSGGAAYYRETGCGPS